MSGNLFGPPHLTECRTLAFTGLATHARWKHSGTRSIRPPSAQMLITAGAGTSEGGLLLNMQREAAPPDGTPALGRKSLPVQPEWKRKAFCFHLVTAEQLNMTCSCWVMSSHYTSSPSESIFCDWLDVRGAVSLLLCQPGGLSIFSPLHIEAAAINRELIK